MRDEKGKVILVEARPLEALGKLSSSQLQALKSRWITSIDEFVGASSMEEGRNGLCAALGLDRESLSLLLEQARALLGDARFRELMMPHPGGPLGAILPSKDLQDKNGE